MKEINFKIFQQICSAILIVLLGIVWIWTIIEIGSNYETMSTNKLIFYCYMSFFMCIVFAGYSILAVKEANNADNFIVDYIKNNNAIKYPKYLLWLYRKQLKEVK